MNGNIGFKIDRESFIVGDKAGSDGDVAIFFTAERTAVLELGALSFFGVRLRAAGIVKGEDAVGCSAGR